MSAHMVHATVWSSTPRRSLVRGAVLLASLLGGSLAQAAVGNPGPIFSPQPREVHAGKTAPAGSVVVSVPGGNAEDLFAAQELETALRADGAAVASAAEPTDVLVRLLRAETPEAVALLRSEHLAFSAEMHDEGYVVIARPGAVTVIGASAAGIFYGVQTLKQMLDQEEGRPVIWTGTVRDWPAMRYRGIHDDLSRGPFPTLTFQKHQLDVFAARKVNLYSPYFEHTLAYTGDPLASPPGSTLSRTEARELVAYAAKLHITVVPEQESFGHLHHRLIYEKFSDLAETPHGHVLAPGQTGSLPLIKSWFTQIAEDFPSPFLHVGADETFELGTGRTKPEVEARGLGPVYADFLTTIHTTLAPLHRRLLFWGDIAESDPKAIPGIPKDMIAIPWIYWHKDSYDGDILPFKQQGLETWVAPGDANWRVVYPLGKTALDNISGFVGAGQRLGSTGELTTVWNDDGEGLFDQDWFGVLFGAAAGWQAGVSDGEGYRAGFGRLFYGDRSGRIDEAQRELEAAEGKIDVSDDAFWMDPWSVQGLAFADKWRKTIPEARLHAEKAIELVEEVRSSEPALRENEALDAMELGARRIDFIGLKTQLSDEMAEAYAKAYARQGDKQHETETRELLYSITSMNGRCQDLRDGYSMLKGMYRESWLKENRPYWLDNVLVRYDLRIQMWQQRGEELNEVINSWQKNHTLPPAAAAGMPPLAR